MPRKAEYTMAMLMAMQPSHHLLYMKSRIMKRTLDNPNWWLKKPIDDSELRLLTKELLRIEIIATTVHYAEVFASTLIAMKRYKRFHKFLLEYKPSEIIKFYKGMTKRRSNYVAGLIQYPQINLVQPDENGMVVLWPSQVQEWRLDKSEIEIRSEDVSIKLKP
ncbi:MAG: hypothetical protein IIA83_08150 [Thaumarchaeota archaeon]|nr:hypothetical protein [Nitrososphaerota archaeon]